MSETPLTPEQIAANEEQAAHENYLHRLLVGLDQFLNVATAGKPDETISARSQRLAAAGNPFGKFMSWWLAKLQPNHGERAEAGDLERAIQIVQLERKALGLSEIDLLK
jgi:hypothetical protein